MAESTKARSNPYIIDFSDVYAHLQWACPGRIIFVQPQFSSGSAELIAKEIGGQFIFADPLASDWLVNLREVAQKFKAALR